MSRTKRRLPTKWLRRPKTLAEKRQVASAEEQGVKVRAKRNVIHIPDAWDDCPVAARKEVKHDH